MKCEATSCLDYIIYHMVNSWPLYSVGFVEWGGESEECKEVRQLKHFLPLSISSILQKSRILFWNITSLSSTRCPSGPVAEGSQGWAAPPWWVVVFKIILSLFVYYCCCDYVHLPVKWCVCDSYALQKIVSLVSLGKGLAYNLEVKRFLSWQPPTTCCSSYTGAPGWRSSPSWSSSRRPRSSRNGCFPCSS